MVMRRGRLVCASLAVLGALPLPAVATPAPADLILHHGKVLTVDRAFSVKSAVAVRNGRILATGGEELLRRYKAAKVIDLKGRTLLPGFTDTHLHPRGPQRHCRGRGAFGGRGAGHAAQEGRRTGAGQVDYGIAMAGKQSGGKPQPHPRRP
jgi:imidazolonepropionase-like amidohydrolase